MKLFAHSNTVITVIKLIIPAATGVALIASGFHSEILSVGINGGNHTNDFAAILTAVATGRHRIRLQRVSESGQSGR